MDIIQQLKNARTGKFRSIVAIGYELVVNIQLGIERTLDVFFSNPCTAPELDQITALIKTFERPKKVMRLVRSIRRLYPNLKIVVVDDSKTPNLIEGVTFIPLPYDSGVSAGRNAGLAVIQTPYMLCLDDDFIFNRHTDLMDTYQAMEQHPEIDLLAGEVIYLPLRIVHDYSERPVFETNKQPIFPAGTLIGQYPVRTKVPNFYMGRTKSIKQVGWDNNLKRLDHADFFTRAVGVLTSVQDASFKVLHYPTYFNQNYMAHKNDLNHDRAVLTKKYGQRL